MNIQRRYPIGAEVQQNGGTHFRVWAPTAMKMEVLLEFGPGAPATIQLEQQTDDYFAGLAPQAATGTRYRFRLNGTGCYTDPASRYQPEGPHGASQVVDPSSFVWHDSGWQGVGIEGQVIYEMHIGTFTREGTWQTAQRELAELADRGMTVLEVMPVADFPGRFGWGYDGVGHSAPVRLYGEPDDFRLFEDEAHRLGLGVILDVVYNHFGLDGSYLKEFSPDCFTDVRESFNQRFWYEKEGYLYDVVDTENGISDDACRPNQIFAISLDHPVLDDVRWKSVMEVVTDRLLTPVGLRSLASSHPDYKARYYGDLRARDAAYHQGVLYGRGSSDPTWMHGERYIQAGRRRPDSS